MGDEPATPLSERLLFGHNLAHVIPSQHKRKVRAVRGKVLDWQHRNVRARREQTLFAGRVVTNVVQQLRADAAIVQHNRARGLDVISEFFEPGLAARLRTERGAAQLVVGANVLCHIPDLNALARSLDVLLDSNGIFIFEDPYLLEIITQLAYDQIYDEHYFYFSVLSLSRLFAAHGLRIFRVEALPVHGGSMRVYGCRAGAQRATEPGVQTQLALERQHGLHLLQTYVDFAERVRQSRAALFTMLYGLKQSGRRIAGYAASSKGTVVLNYCGIGPQLLDYICDNTPGKQGLFAPGTHIPVLPIEHFAADRPDFAFVLAWNHMREIMAKEQAFTQAGGRFITHIPSAAIV